MVRCGKLMTSSVPWRIAFCEETLVRRIRVAYFLEDRAHESLLKAIVRRVAREEGLPEAELVHDVRSSRGGQALARFAEFVRDYSQGADLPFDFLVVAVDANCSKYSHRVKQLRQLAEKAHYPAVDRIAFAVPDPHIERWYLLDPVALRRAIGGTRGPNVPAYKCEKAYYKSALRKILEDAGIDSLLGGVEYGEQIVQNINDWLPVVKRDTGFRHFLQDLRSCFRSVSRL